MASCMGWGKDDYERSKSMAAQRMTRFQECLPDGEAFQSKGRLQPRPGPAGSPST